MSGWKPQKNWTPRLGAVALASVALGAVAALAWSDAAGLTRSSLCGPSCLDRVVADALTAPHREFEATYPGAHAAAERQLEMAPFDTGGWLRLAMLEIRHADGRLSPEAIAALKTSYDRAPVDATVAHWRIPLVFDLWNQVPFDLRLAASNEVKVLHHAAPETQLELRRLIGRMNSLEGRFAYRLLIESLDDAYYRDEGRETPKAIPIARDQSPAKAGN